MEICDNTLQFVINWQFVVVIIIANAVLKFKENVGVQVSNVPVLDISISPASD